METMVTVVATTVITVVVAGEMAGVEGMVIMVLVAADKQRRTRVALQEPNELDFSIF